MADESKEFHGLVLQLINPEQEIISIYPMLSPPTLSPHASNRVSQIPLYLYPFLNTVSRHRPFEYLRLTSLGVIGAL
eukprot:gene33788-38186_t